MFKKILIANRGEIACRVIRACQGLGIRAVAVYSDVDQKALHVRQADEAYALGDPQPQKSYLNIPKLIDVARQAKVDAVHPGYGFLSENAAFAEACQEAGLVFIGPPPAVIRQMGDKICARNFLEKQGVPLVPGTDQPLGDEREAARFAGVAGYPVLLKAAAGGGGKGMRVVSSEEGLSAALESCRREAKAAFGDDRIFLEKYLENPHHVEIQIVADHFGNVIHLGERECSLQRRHQKVVEETPSPLLDEDLRNKMGEMAVRIGRAIGYQNLGTIEFIVDPHKNFYFLEVNTRLQVEHPITEMVTGVDLVKTQIRIAAGEKLAAIVGPRPVPDGTGHAIECRICAEDPAKQFLPSIGKITGLQEPTGEGVRLDSGIYAGWEIPMEYDPLLAKLVVHAPTRARAIVKMLQALGELQIQGIRTNVRFLMDLLRHPEFIAGQTDTGFIPRNFATWEEGPWVPEDPFNPWNMSVSSRAERGDLPEVAVSGGWPRRPASGGTPRHDHRSSVDHDLTAPMPGSITKVLVREGASVKAGQPLVILEAMKMEHSIFAPHEGKVVKIFFREGERVGMGEKLVELK